MPENMKPATLPPQPFAERRHPRKYSSPPGTKQRKKTEHMADARRELRRRGIG